MAKPRRQQRVAETLKKEIGELLQKGVADPHLDMVSVTSVEISPDLRYARVFVSHLGDVSDKEVLQALKRASKFLRRELGGRMTLRVMPELAFEIDRSLEQGSRIEALLAQVEADQQEQA